MLATYINSKGRYLVFFKSGRGGGLLQLKTTEHKIIHFSSQIVQIILEILVISRSLNNFANHGNSKNLNF